MSKTPFVPRTTHPRPPKKWSAGAKALLCVVAVLPAFLIWSNDPGVVLSVRIFAIACLSASLSFSVAAMRRDSDRGLGIIALLVSTLLITLIAGSWL